MLDWPALFARLGCHLRTVPSARTNSAGLSSQRALIKSDDDRNVESISAKKL